MIQFLTVTIGLAILSAIFLRRYLMVEKGIGMRSLFIRRKDLLRHHHHAGTFEVTANEVLPPSGSIDPKKIARAAILLKKAEVHLNKGDIRNTEKTLIQAISLDPSCVEAYNKLGLIYLRQSQFGKAESIYRKLILTVASEPAFFSNLGMALYSQHKLEEAKTYYKKAIELDSTRAGRFFSLGQIFHELGELEDALQNLQKAVDMEPRNLDYLLSLAQLYVDSKMYSEAVHLLDEILLMKPENKLAQDLKDRLKNIAPNLMAP